MPRDGSGVYTKPFPNVVTGTPISSTVYNGFVGDVETDLNAPRPVIAGGTGGNSPAAARDNLDAERSMQVVTNYDSQVWEPGSFYSASGATSAPTGNAFSGIVYGPDANNMVIEARDQTTGKIYVRIKTAGVWAAWGTDPAYVSKSGDTMSGNLTISKANAALIFDEPDASSPAIWALRAGQPRWLMSLASGTESSGNAGSDLMLLRYNDAGTLIDTCLSINRATAALSLSGNIATSKSSPSLTLNNTDTSAGSSIDIRSHRNGLPRWIMRMQASAETGSNAGSDFILFNCNDAGGLIGQAVMITRSDSHVNFAGYVQIDKGQLFLNKPASGQSASFYGLTANQPRWLIELGSSDAESGASTGSSFALHRYNNAGTYLGQVLGIDRTSGLSTFNTPATFSAAPTKCNGGNSATSNATGDLQVQGGIGAFGDCWFSNKLTVDTVTMGTTAGLNYAWGRNNGTGFLKVSGAQPSFSGYEFWVQSTSGQIIGFQVNNNGFLKANYTAGTLVSDGSGNISVSSDERMKNVLGPFTRGLDALRKIGGADIFSWKHEAETLPNQRYAGFLAQKVQRGIPEAVNVSSHDGMLALDDRPLIATLMNAVLELADRIDQLTGDASWRTKSAR